MPLFHLPPIELNDERYCWGCPKYGFDFMCDGEKELPMSVDNHGERMAARPDWCPLIPVKEEQEEKK